MIRKALLALLALIFPALAAAQRPTLSQNVRQVVSVAYCASAGLERTAAADGRGATPVMTPGRLSMEAWAGSIRRLRVAAYSVLRRVSPGILLNLGSP